MTTLVFDYSAFILAYPAFNDDTNYPQAVLQNYWTMATAYISDSDYGWLSGTRRTLALNLMTAHLTALGAMIAAGTTPSMVTSTTIDKISVTLTPPPAKTQFQWWLNTTPYGMQLSTLLSLIGVGGVFVGGAPERSAFRGAYGQFN